MSNKYTSTSNKASNLYRETIYREICNNIRFTDEISLRLPALVPLVSGSGLSGISIVLVTLEMKWSPIFAGIYLSLVQLWSLDSIYGSGEISSFAVPS